MSLGEVVEVPGRARRGRRASGSHTALDVLRLVLGRGGSPEADLAALAAGDALRVSAFLRTSRWRQGELVLDPTAPDHPVTWRARPRGTLRRSPCPSDP
ncbi:hypothetical protein [Cellulomonas cellasea]|uniref:Uncharacterized protein n=1 Tax=Cellulomonas cellasea TaxID=43670 RepID=A0A7W4UJ54_9CELL|nr:hypothetical protein [Cellulomonas cellasea]MBB2924814.1 hypothetical protein [Cellulomonas cellasea]